MKRKQFIKGTEQIAQEGAIQIFKLPGAGLEEVIVGVVGTLQFDVFQYRMRSEYGVGAVYGGPALRASAGHHRLPLQAGGSGAVHRLRHFGGLQGAGCWWPSAASGAWAS